ncbi:WD40 repeat domain-containing protein [Blastopirellula sp. JC732]|uniref:WD40 repeat domain-containing protein n=1 Tax=Blastopirellula sediminis TaxID=2894196 RepID=A0A9X1MS31_9BACT|nr:WD40 repeat domain-containing protein [Blastopirellula sediminis]MCC9605243.1 WD40 repeat domain-containing protein [Blastopirellula sediminis]MCC9631457.1 WD40 repeat domain-containing protein [Blastopirellula sediminis]
MPHARLPLLLIALVALVGCGRAKPVKPAVPVTMPEDGGQAGTDFEASWTDAYAVAARQAASVATATPSPTPRTTAFSGSSSPTTPSRTTSPSTMTPSVTSPPVNTPSPVAQTPHVSNPIDIDQLAPTIEPLVLRVSMTKTDGSVVQGAGVVVAPNGVVLTAAGLLQDAVAGEVEFCNKQKTRVVGHFADPDADPSELAAITIDTHGHELEAISLNSAIGRSRTSAKMGDPLLLFDARGFPFSPQQVVVTSLTTKPRMRSGSSAPPRNYDQLTSSVESDLTQPGSPWFDRSGALIAITVQPSPADDQLHAVAINEIADQLAKLDIDDAAKYTGTPGPTPPPQKPRPAAQPATMQLPVESISAPTTIVNGSTSWTSRAGAPAVEVNTYSLIDKQQRFIRFAMSPDGKWGAVISTGGKIYVYDLRVKKLAAVITTSRGDYLDCAFFTYDDKLVTLRPRYGAGDRPLSCWDLRKLEMAGNWAVDVDAQKLAVPKNNLFIVVADARGSVMTTIFRNSQLTYYEKSPVVASHDGGGELTALAVDPLSQNIVLGFSDGKVSIMGAIGNRVRKLTEFEPHPGAAVRDIAFSADSQIMATCSDDGGVRFWEKWQADFRANPINLKEDGQAIHNVVLGYRGRLAIGASTKSGAVLWDTETKSVLDRFESTPPAIQVELSETAGKFAIVSEDGTVKIWPIKGPSR